MIAVAIVGSVLAAAFAVTNQNLRATQDTQEQAVAVKLVQQQLELLSTYAFDGSGNCFNPDGSGAYMSDMSGYCKITDGASGATYDIKVTGGPSYTVVANWTGLSDNKKSITMYYYKGN